MKKLTLLALAMLLTLNLFAQEDRAAWFSEELQGTITALDTDSREVTVVGQEGNIVTLMAGEEVERFNELEVGDLIKLEYWTFMMAEFRNPSPEELAEPLVILAEAGKVDLDMPPGAAIGALVKAVVTVEVINRPYMDVVVKGPQGNFMTIPVEDPELIEMLNVGKVVILTYGEAMALYIEKI
ncbi:MAG: hypothetical protein GY823_10105 [Flavobacteriaceae bacterium]|nr:hypothetical protein [Flavobacteriaceae bacterium]